LSPIKTYFRLAFAAIALPTATIFASAVAVKLNPDEALVQSVHRLALTIDPHIDIAPTFNGPGNDASQETTDQFDLAKLERGGLDVATVTLAASQQKRSPETIAAARKEIDAKLAAIRGFVAQNPSRLEFAHTGDDLQRIPAKGKHAILLSFLNAFPLGQDLSLLSHYQKEGVRVFGFVHAGNNDWADSSRPSAGFGDKPDALGGLSPLGQQAVAELNRLGVIVDVSQLTPSGVFQVVQLSRAPVIASHSGIRGRVDVTRNLANEELTAIAATGGVVHIVAFPGYLRDLPEARAARTAVFTQFGVKETDDVRAKLSAEDYAKFRAAYAEDSRKNAARLGLVDWLDSVDYAVRLIGIDHVGLSTDFNHGGGVTGYADVGEGPNVTRELLKRGYSPDDISKLWGGNFLRVFREVEATARRLQTEKLAAR
jgi:membrane dipeptidase